MSDITDYERFNKLNANFWERSRVDNKGRVVIPQSLRRKLGINGKSCEILWITAHRDSKHDNIFHVQIGVKK